MKTLQRKTQPERSHAEFIAALPVLLPPLLPIQMRPNTLPNAGVTAGKQNAMDTAPVSESPKVKNVENFREVSCLFEKRGRQSQSRPLPCLSRFPHCVFGRISSDACRIQRCALRTDAWQRHGIAGSQSVARKHEPATTVAATGGRLPLCLLTSRASRLLPGFQPARLLSFDIPGSTGCAMRRSKCSGGDKLLPGGKGYNHV